MKKLLSILLLFFFITSLSFAQLENTNWCFGYHARVNFLASPPTVSTSVYSPYLNVSCPTVSDLGGQLLFYSDGPNVYGSNHSVINNGGDIWGFNQLGQQSSVIVPKPGHPDIYYLFTIGATSIPLQGNEVGRGGIHYSVIDMSVGNGNIDNSVKNISLKNTAGTPIDYAFSDQSNPMFLSPKSRITTTLNATGDKIWVTIIAVYGFQAPHTRVFYNYLVDVNGIGGVGDGTPPVPAVENSSFLASNYITSNPYKPASMKISPDGSKLCDAEDVVVNLYTYERLNGTMTHSKTIAISGPDNTRSVGYGVEFSPDNSKIYYTHNPTYIVQDGLIGSTYNVNPYGSIYQYDINTERLREIYSHLPSPGLVPFPAKGGWGLQLAMDGKIYVCTGEYQSHLGAIKDPNNPYPNCNFDPIFLPLATGTFNGNQMPQWVHKASVNIWPKIYEAVESNGIKIDNQGNIFHNIYLQNMANNMNHYGQTTNSTGDHYVQYNRMTGFTNWVNSNYSWIYFGLSSGDVNVVTPTGNNVYINGSSGMLVTGPTNNISPTERILAEDNGAIITKSGYSLYAHSSTGAISFPVSIPTIPGYSLTNDIIGREAFYNPDPGSRNLYVSHIYTNGSSTIRLLGIYHYDLVTNTLSVLNTPTSNQLNGPIIQVNTKIPAEVFVYNYNGTIEKYDYQNGIHTPLSASNFINSSLEIVQRSNQVVEDRILIKSISQNVFYCINTVLLSAKKILFTPPSTNYQFYNHYVFDGDYVFIAGEYTGSGFMIGNQMMPLLGNGSAFITKFNVQTDFSFGLVSEDLFSNQKEDSIKTIPLLIQHNKLKKELQSSGITATLSPNPAKNKLLINIKQADSKDAESFQISISNNQGVFMYKQDTKQTTITVDISAFRVGMYYVNIANMKGNRTTHAFIKE